MKQIYFSHDCSARIDEKIIKMVKKLGAEGYGIYWMLVEKLHSTEDGYLDIDYEVIAYDLRIINIETLKSVINDFNLFTTSGDKFTSNRVLKNMQKAAEKRDKATVSAFARWNKDNNANALPTQSEGNAIKENKIKENKIKENKIKENVVLDAPKVAQAPKKTIPPTQEAVNQYCIEQNYLFDPKRFYDYYTANGWKVGKNPMRDWQAALRNWNRQNSTLNSNINSDQPAPVISPLVAEATRALRQAKEQKDIEKYGRIMP